MGGLREADYQARALSQALVDQWASTLDKSTMTDANKESIMKMARDFPKESMEMLRVAQILGLFPDDYLVHPELESQIY